MVLWKLPRRMPKSSHSFKYRLYYGIADGTCLVRYDNEKNKGDHRHIAVEEKQYKFTNIETLVSDFLMDIENARGGAKHEKKHKD